MKKKMLSLSLVVLLALLTGCGWTTSSEELYQHAQLCLGSGEYEAARIYFTQLGEYRDAANYALYAGALEAWQAGDTSLARRTLESIRSFKSAERYLTYLDAMDAAERGEKETALALHEGLGAFGDSALQANKLREQLVDENLDAIDSALAEENWALAEALMLPLANDALIAQLLEECRSDALSTAYDQARQDYAAGNYPAALEAFTALGDQLDAPARAVLCTELIYRLAENAFPVATLENAQDLVAWYEAVEDYGESEARLAALRERFGSVLALMAQADAHPYVLYQGQLCQVTSITGTLAEMKPCGTEAAQDTSLLRFSLAKSSPVCSVPATVQLDLNTLYLTAGTGTEADPYR